jgi:hypothetical protein
MQAYPETDKEIAAFWGVKIRTLFRWKGDGAPIHSYEEMLAWLSTRKNLPRAVLEKIKLPGEPNVSSSVNGGSGAAAALKRLESCELQAFTRLQKALADGNPLMVRECRESWLKISESLRRFDLLVEASRRDAGELVPVSQVQEFIDAFIAFGAVAFAARAETLTNELCGHDEITIFGQLRQTFDITLISGVFGFLKDKAADPRLVAYAEECVRGRFAHDKRTSIFDDIERGVLNVIERAKEQQ